VLGQLWPVEADSEGKTIEEIIKEYLDENKVEYESYDYMMVGNYIIISTDIYSYFILGDFEDMGDGKYRLTNNPSIPRIAGRVSKDFTSYMSFNATKSGILINVSARGHREKAKEKYAIEDSTGEPFSELNGDYYKFLTEIPDDYEIYTIIDGERYSIVTGDEIKDILKSKKLQLTKTDEDETFN
jgi:hypothetical protein